MSRKDYELAAEMLRHARMITPTDTWVSIMEFFVAYFRASSHNFDAQRFKNACTR
jgi:uncharacterized protein YpbB